MFLLSLLSAETGVKGLGGHSFSHTFLCFSLDTVKSILCTPGQYKGFLF